MLTVYHPRQWAFQWPTNAKPYATAKLAEQAHPEVAPSDIVGTHYIGNPADVIQELPEAAPVATEAPAEVQPEAATEEAPKRGKTPKKGGQK